MPISIQRQFAHHRPTLTRFNNLVLRALRSAAPFFLTLFVVSAAHAQGTMDFSGAQTLMGTFNWRNDYVSVEQWSRFIQCGMYVYNSELHDQHQKFAKLWDKNLREQRFLEAFERQRT